MSDESIEELVTTIEGGLSVVADDIEAGLSDAVCEAMAELREVATTKFLKYRAAFKKANKDIRYPELEKLINAYAPQSDQQDSDVPGTVENIIAMVQSMGELFMGTNEVPYIKTAVDEHFEVHAIDGSVFKEILSHEYYKAHGRAPKSQQLNDALVTLAGCARYDGEIREVHMRVAKHGKGYLLDMADEKWRVISCTPEGVRVLNESPVLFTRTKGMQPTFYPDCEGSESDLKKLINVEENKFTLLVAALCECLRPDTAYPIIMIHGGHGSGKSATHSNIRRLIDPNKVPLRAAPKKTEDIFVATRNNHMVSYNNLSNLTPEFQDAFCSVSTGGGFAARQLYTDGDEVTYEAKKPTVINGITPGLINQADALSRVIKLECPKIDNRLKDSELSFLLEEIGPKALGCVLTIFCKALALLPEIEIENSPRMMDFCQLGEAVSRAMGNEAGEFMDEYRKFLDIAAKQSIEGVPVIEKLIEYVKAESAVSNTVGGLLNELTDKYGGRYQHAWPKTAKGFRDSLSKHEPAMRLMGITIEYPSARRNGQSIEIFFSDSEKSTGERPSPLSPPSQDGEKVTSLAERRESENQQINSPEKKEKNEVACL